MSKADPDLDIVAGSGNAFRDVGLPDPDTRLIKADLAAEIIRVLRTARLSNVAAAHRAGVAETDISRIRHADLNRFTIDRLVRILNRLDRRVEVVITEEPRRGHA
jgi:predicted XRE-type DNA-binding protein